MRTRHFAILILLAAALAVMATVFILAPPWTWKARWYIKKKAEYANVPIAFYGRVIEQDGTPVGSANVLVEVGLFESRPLSNKDPVTSRTIAATTDTNGYFSLAGLNGKYLQVRAISKEGYHSDLKVARTFSYSPSYDIRERHFPDPANPVLFYMWKRGATESLIQRERTFAVRPDNSPVTIDLLTGKSQPGRVSTGDLQVSLKRPEGLLYPKGIYDWEFEIKAVNGGILETTDVFPYQAPEIGYQNGYKYALRTSNLEGGLGVTKRYYVRGRDGSFFASLELEVNSAADSPDGPLGAFYFRYLLNPRGSRNLEPDRSKKLNP